MAAPVLSAAATILCPHGGSVAATSVAPRVLVAGAPVLTLGAPAAVQGCVLQAGQGCASVVWQAGAGRVLAGGNPVLIQSATGACLTAAGQPTGAAIVAATQSRVSAR